jgi:UDPglucose--hexose-1-phosphate uridylyltransferase
VLGRWVIIATERAARPSDFKSEAQPPKSGFCPFCKGNEAKTPPEIMAYREAGSRPNEGGWRVRVVPNKFPALRVEGDLGKVGYGIYDMMNGIGAHEVIIETPEHQTSLAPLSEANIREVLWAYRDRLVDLKKDRRLVYGMVFKNVGSVAGASLEHTHSQLICTPIVPRTVVGEMNGAQEFFRYRGRCLFCDMIQQEVDSAKRVVLDGPQFVSFAPFASRFPFETWILPRQHSSHFENLQRMEVDELARTLKVVLTKLERSLENPPYNYILHTAPFNTADLEHFHWHIEIIPRLTKVAGFEWGTGFYINPVPPEKAAEFMRGVEV